MENLIALVAAVSAFVRRTVQSLEDVLFRDTFHILCPSRKRLHLKAPTTVEIRVRSSIGEKPAFHAPHHVEPTVVSPMVSWEFSF